LNLSLGVTRKREASSFLKEMTEAEFESLRGVGKPLQAVHE
jgi:hypothetical protein